MDDNYDTEDKRKVIKEIIPENLIIDEIQEGKEPLGDIIALKDKKRISVDLVQQLESRLMLIESWINGTEDLDFENDPVNQDGTLNKKKECEEIAQEIKSFCDQIEADIEVLHLKQKLLLQKLHQYKVKSAKLQQHKENKWGKAVGILGAHMPQQLPNFDQQLVSKVESAKQVFNTSSARLESLKGEICELKTTCEDLLTVLQQKEAESKTLKKEQDEKISHLTEDFDISEKMVNLCKSFSNVNVQKPGKNFVQVEMTSNIGEPKSLLVTLYFKPHDFQGISLEDIQVNNTNLYITDCVKTVRVLKNIPACLNSIRERWHYYLHMAEHLKDIQERLPIDWIQQENKLRVVVGKNANVICSLQLPSAQQSWVSLLDVRGGETSDLKTDLLKPTNPEASLQEWIEYLEEKFS